MSVMANNTEEYNFKVECLEAGQRRPYGDSYFHYVVESDNSEFVVKQFCTKVLQYAPISKDEVKAHIEKEGFAGNFTSYVTLFEKQGNKYHYKVTSPSTH